MTITYDDFIWYQNRNQVSRRYPKSLYSLERVIRIKPQNCNVIYERKTGYYTSSTPKEVVIRGHDKYVLERRNVRSYQNIKTHILEN